jgi:hypothetical protein
VISFSNNIAETESRSDDCVDGVGVGVGGAGDPDSRSHNLEIRLVDDVALLFPSDEDLTGEGTTSVEFILAGTNTRL